MRGVSSLLCDVCRDAVVNGVKSLDDDVVAFVLLRFILL